MNEFAARYPSDLEGTLSNSGPIERPVAGLKKGDREALARRLVRRSCERLAANEITGQPWCPERPARS